jgi:hypothetical protein
MKTWIDVCYDIPPQGGSVISLCLIRPCGVPRAANLWYVHAWLLKALYPGYDTMSKLRFAARMARN